MKRIVVIGSIAILSIGGIFLFLSSKQTTSSSEPVVSLGRFFPKAEQSEQKSDIDAIVNNTTPSGTDPTTTYSPTGATGPFTQIIKNPVAGYIAFDRVVQSIPTVPGEQSKKITEHVIRYVSRTNGYVYEIVNGSIPLRITNILIPNIYEAYFTPDGKTVLQRFLRDDGKTIATYSVPIPEQNPDGTRTQKEGVYLPDNITSIAISPDGKKAVASIPTSPNTSIVTITLPTTGITITTKELYKSPFSEWILSWPTQQAIYMQTKASNVSNGFLYNLDNITVKLRRVLGTISGLTTSVSPDGKKVLYSSSGTTAGISTFLYTISTGASIPIGHNILPEKCDWLSTNDLMCAGNDSVEDLPYPDSWYAGVMHFSDIVFKIDSKTGNFTTLSDGTIPFDMTHLQTSEQEQYVYFIDKNNGSLWRLSY